MSTSTENPIYAPFFGVMGAASAIIFSGMYSLCLVLIEMAVLTHYRSPKIKTCFVVIALEKCLCSKQIPICEMNVSKKTVWTCYFRRPNNSSSRALSYVCALNKYACLCHRTLVMFGVMFVKVGLKVYLFC